MNFSEILDLAKTDEKLAFAELKKLPRLSPEEVVTLKEIISKFWDDNLTKEEMRQMVFASTSLLSRSEAHLDIADFAAIESIDSSEFFYEVYPEARPVETN